jgi:hypothetical protein
VVGTALGALFARTPLPAGAREVEAGKYLPPAPSSPGFVFFKATTKDTPALRAGDHSVLASLSPSIILPSLFCVKTSLLVFEIDC